MRKSRNDLTCPKCGSVLTQQKGIMKKFYCNNPKCTVVFVRPIYSAGKEIVGMKVVEEAIPVGC